MIRATGRTLTLAAVGFLPALVPAMLGMAYAWVPIGATAVLLGCLAAEALFLSGRAVPHLEVALTPRTVLGNTGRIECTISGFGERVRQVAVLVELEGAVDPPPIALQSVNSDRRAQVSWVLTPHRRGTIKLMACWLRWPGPLGLLTREHRCETPAELEVVPDFGAAGREALRFSNRQDLREGLKLERYVGEGTEFDSLREWQSGMGRRSIDWKSSARHVRLLAREYRVERSHQIILAFDTGRSMGESLDGFSRLDHALRAGLHLAWLGLRSQDGIGISTFDSQLRTFVPPATQLRALAPLQSALSTTEVRPVETNYARALTELQSKVSRRSLIVVFTEFSDSVSAELMLQAIERLARRHLVLFVAMRDPVPGRYAGVEPRTTADLHRAVVGHHLVKDREVVLARLRRLGVLVVDAASGELRSELLQKYIDVKRRELIR